MTETARLDPLAVLSISQAAAICGLSRNTIAAAMDRYTVSGGESGLAWIMPGPRRRGIVRESLGAWLHAMEGRS